MGWALLWGVAGVLSESRSQALEARPIAWQRVELPGGGALVESRRGAVGEWALAEEWEAELKRLEAGDVPELFDAFVEARARK